MPSAQPSRTWSSSEEAQQHPDPRAQSTAAQEQQQGIERLKWRLSYCNFLSTKQLSLPEDSCPLHESAVASPRSADSHRRPLPRSGGRPDRGFEVCMYTLISLLSAHTVIEKVLITNSFPIAPKAFIAFASNPMRKRFYVP